MYKYLIVFFIFIIISCNHIFASQPSEIKTAAQQINRYLPLLRNKPVAIIANQSSIIGSTHLVDTLVSLGINVKKIFSPEHGFRGNADAGEHVNSEKDIITGIPIISLYGNDYKPKDSDMKGIKILIFDIQDVGVRFYTYISTMHYAMEACAENNITFLVLDRPNPNGFYVDGPVLEKGFESFVGMHQVPIVHGMTVAEYAIMINEEGWLKNGIKCDLKYILCENYTHKDFYMLPVKPSPNLPNMSSVYLYPTLCLFEGTVISIGRGTGKPFQVVGHPELKGAEFNFVPQSIDGAAKTPLFQGQKCYGYDLSDYGGMFIRNLKKLYLYWITGAFESVPDKEKFFNDYFEKLAGTANLKKQIIEKLSEPEIRKSWEPELGEFKKMRKKYLLYTDFD